MIKRANAFTLAEMMVALAVASVIVAALLIGLVSLQRSYSASVYYSSAVCSQIRVLDYIVRDARGCVATPTISSDGRTLTLTLPDYYSSYDAQGNPTSAPVAPTVNSSKKVGYNGFGTRTIVYSPSGRTVIRQVTIPRTGTSSSTVIATDLDNLALKFTRPGTWTLSAELSFSPRFRGIASTTNSQTTRSATVYMRNLAL